MSKKRAQSPVLKNIMKKLEENPIVKSEVMPIVSITTKQHISELHDILVQTCIDYINKYNLTDIYSVHFNADSLSESAKEGSWQPCTDSYISVEGRQKVINTRKNGDQFDSEQIYNIGDEY